MQDVADSRRINSYVKQEFQPKQEDEVFVLLNFCFNLQHQLWLFDSAVHGLHWTVRHLTVFFRQLLKHTNNSFRNQPPVPFLQ